MSEGGVEWVRALWTLRTIHLHTLVEMFLYNCDFDNSTFSKFLFCNAFLLLCWLGNQFVVVRSWHVLVIECSFCLNEPENDMNFLWWISCTFWKFHRIKTLRFNKVCNGTVRAYVHFSLLPGFSNFFQEKDFYEVKSKGIPLGNLHD